MTPLQTVQVPRLSVAEKTELLEEIAADVEDYPDRAIDLLLRAVAATHLDDASRRDAWDRYVTILRLRDDIAEGVRDWTALGQNIPGPDQTETALLICEDDLAEALRDLIGDPS
jgi:hypothetical protein